MAVNQDAIATQVQAALTSVQSAIAAAGTLSTATPFALAPAAAAVAAAVSTVQNAIAAFDADMITTSVAGMVVGSPPPVLWPILLNQVSDSQQIAVLLDALGYLQRLATNLAEATG